MKQLTKNELYQLLKWTLKDTPYDHIRLNGMVIYYNSYEFRPIEEDDFALRFYSDDGNIICVYRTYEMNVVQVDYMMYEIVD